MKNGPKRLHFECGTLSLALVCDEARAPRTLEALSATLPATLQLHCPKIAGSHVYWHAPFVTDVEGAIDVMDAGPGAFIYWPERQFLELVYAPLQAETAAVTLIGRVEGDIEPLVELGETLRRQHGRTLTSGRLTAADGSAPASGARSWVAGRIVAARERLWSACPADIGRMIASRAIMHPAGPLFMAEAEARGLHEYLWLLRGRVRCGEELMSSMAAALAAEKAADRLAGFCHLEICAAAIRDLADAFRETSPPSAALFDEAILTAGRIAAWLDLEIPWQDVNTAVRVAHDAREPA